MGRKSSVITLSKEDRERLEAQVRARTSQAQTVTRAKVLLLKADGKTADEIESLLKGINCNGRGTSCGDQLARAVREAAG